MNAIPMRSTAADDAVSDKVYRATADELTGFIGRVERLDGERKDLADTKKDVFAEAKARGYDVKALRKLIAERKRDPQDLAEEQAVLDLYREALGS